MNHRNSTELFLRMAQQYQADMAVAAAYIKEKDIHGRLNTGDTVIDTRDFLPMILLMGIQGDTPEARENDIHQKLEELANAFGDPDHSKRKKYLDMIYNLVDDIGDKFDPKTMDMYDPEHVGKLLQGMLLTQTLGKKESENPEYYNRRYPTPEARNLADARKRYNLAVAGTVTTNLANHNIAIKIILSLPPALPVEMLDLQYLREDYERSLLETAIQTKGKLPVSTTVDFPILDSLVPFCGKNVADIKKFSKSDEDQVERYYNYMVQNTLLQSGSKNTQGMKMADIGNVKEAVYIDGKPFEDFIKKRYPKGTSGSLIDVVAGICMLGGKHKVDIVNAYPNADGVMQYEARTVRPAITPQQEALYMQQFSWIRRKLFNWGPFRIESLRERIERDPKAHVRLAGVITEHKARIERALERKQQNAVQSQHDDLQKAQHRMSFLEAKEQLEASAKTWDKDSVIGVLGQQITAKYMIKGTEETGACNAIRKAIASASEPGEIYGNMAPLFVKVLLYSQLCSERAANNGEPGELEQLLGTNDTIPENIENTTRDLVNDPIFKNLVFKKMSSQLGAQTFITRGKFQEFIVSGGCAGFWMEYKQNIKERDNQTEPKVSKNANPLENQKNQNVPNNSI